MAMSTGTAPGGVAGGDGSAGAGERPELRIDELARQAGTTVRNVRAYQERGLLPPPRRQGRLAWYSDAHLARLRVIGELLERGYTLANIAELVTAWETGQDVGALLGLEAALGATWGVRSQVTSTAGELVAMFGPQSAAWLEEAVEAGLLAEEGEGSYRVLNPAALEIGALLTSSGAPLGAVIAAARHLRDEVDSIAHRFVDLVEVHVFDPVGEPIPAREAQRLARLVERLRPLTSQVVETELARAMERQVQRRLGDHLHRFAQALATSQQTGTTSSARR